MEVIHVLQSVASPALDRFMLLVTQLGSQQAYIVLLLIAYIGVDARSGRGLAIAFLTGFYLNEQLKAAFHTQRPFQLEPGVVRSQAALATAQGSGFPSGHAQGATMFWGLAAFYARRRWFAGLAVAIIVLVSLSRLYLGVHLPIDIVGGIAVGSVVVALALALGRWRRTVARGAVVGFGLLVPLALHLLFPTPDSGVLMGALAAFLIGPELVPHVTDGPWRGRLVLTGIGIAVVFGVQLGSHVLIPEAVRHAPLGAFVRYLLVGISGTMLVPWLGRALRLVPAAAAVRG